MADAGGRWTLEEFIDRLDMWADREGLNVDEDLRIVVTAWLFTRMDDPYQGVQRQPGFENLWYGVIPGSGDGKGHVVGCSYWIIESERIVRCDNYGLLSWPA